jgi:hypothetical protein
MLGKYNAKDWTVMVKGTYITGLGEDMFSADKDEDMFSTSVGAQGDVVKSEINNPLGTITITVQQTSPQYKFLLDLANESDPFSVWCINKTLGRRVGGTLANLKKPPEESHGSEAEDVEFEFQIYDYVDEAA